MNKKLKLTSTGGPPNEACRSIKMHKVYSVNNIPQ